MHPMLILLEVWLTAVVLTMILMSAGILVLAKLNLAPKPAWMIEAEKRKRNKESRPPS